MRLLDRLFNLKPNEGKLFLLCFLSFFCIVALTISGKTARDAYFLSRYDRAVLPIMFGAGAAAVGISVAIYTRMMTRLGSRNARHLTSALFAASLPLLQPWLARRSFAKSRWQ